MSSIKLTGDTSGEITISAPAVAGTNTLTLPASTSTIATTDVATNTPIFAVRLASTQTISDATDTKIAFDTEEIDTDNAFDSTTNYRFTVPTGKAGKYKFDLLVRVDSNTSNDLRTGIARIYKNGSIFKGSYNNYSTNDIRAVSFNVSCIADLSVGDYIEAYTNVNTIDNGSVSINGGTFSQFSGHRLIG
jgi:hypothetical protein